LSGKQIPARTRDLSLQGCFVTSPTRFHAGSNIRVTIVHEGSKVLAFGRVAFARAEGMGIAFTKLGPGARVNLERLMSSMLCHRRFNPAVEKQFVRGEVGAFIDRLKPQWHAFLEQLADAQFPNANPVGWKAEDEAWRDTYRSLDCIAAAFLSWQGSGKAIPEWGPMDAERLLELTAPHLENESNRHLFIATCQDLMSQWRKLHRTESHL